MLKTLKNHFGFKGKVSVGCESDRYSPLQNYELHVTLGTGTFGRVRLVREKITKGYFALKSSKKCDVVRLKQVEHIKNEISLLKRLDHPGIVNLVHFFHDDFKIYLVMEYVEGGEMFNHLSNMGRFSNQQSLIYAGEIVLVFDYIHSNNIAYRDLKPENILITKEGRLKLADFGFAKVVEKRTWTLCGTPEYLAPEIIQSKGHGKAVDWWALGILIYEMLVGYPPFNSDNPVEIYKMILSGRYEMPSYIEVAAQDIIHQFLQEDRTKRLGCTKGSTSAIQSHEWFTSVDWDDIKLQKHVAPFIPRVSFAGDTSNFERYPESIDDQKSRNLSTAEKVHFDELENF